MPTLALPDQPWVIDLSARAKLRLTGADRVRFLNGQVSNDIRRATSTDAVYACVMTIKGKMCAEAYIHAGTDCLLIDAPGELREALAARLERYIIADDVTLEDVTDEYTLRHVIGDGPGGVRSQRFGHPGIDLWSDSSASLPAGNLLNGLQAETVRILAGIPAWGAELGEDTLPAEADLEGRAVDFAKGCYIGQEVVSRIKSVGHVNWNLRGFRSVGAHLRAAVSLTSADGKVIARITSVVPSLDGSGGLALGYVRRGYETPGTILPAEAGEVEVCSLPFPS